MFWDQKLVDTRMTRTSSLIPHAAMNNVETPIWLALSPLTFHLCNMSAGNANANDRRRKRRRLDQRVSTLYLCACFGFSDAHMHACACLERIWNVQ